MVSAPDGDRKRLLQKVNDKVVNKKNNGLLRFVPFFF